MRGEQASVISRPSLIRFQLWPGRQAPTAPPTSSIDAGSTIPVCQKNRHSAGVGEPRFIPTTLTV